MILKTALRVFAVFLWALISTPTISLAQQSTPLDQVEQEAIKALILQTIRENPDVLVDTLLAFQEEAEAAAQAQQRAAIQRVGELLRTDANTGVMGNPEGDIVLVEFFDYNCPYCRQVASVMAEAEAGDPELRVVYKEFPILGPGSVFAAKAALAADRQGRYVEFHKALMDADSRVDETSVLAIAEEVGLDVERLKQDMQDPAIQAEIDGNLELAQALRITGTPGFVIGDEFVRGATDLETMTGLIEAARNGKAAGPAAMENAD